MSEDFGAERKEFEESKLSNFRFQLGLHSENHVFIRFAAAGQTGNEEQWFDVSVESHIISIPLATFRDLLLAATQQI